MDAPSVGMKQVESSLRTLTQTICQQLAGAEIPRSSVWTVIGQGPDAHVALEVDRPAFPDMRFSITLKLLHMPEYQAATERIAEAPEFMDGVIVDAGGFLGPAEPINSTRALVTNFLWRYVRQGREPEWSAVRFAETFAELRTALDDKSVVSHTILPLSNLRMDTDRLGFGAELTLAPATAEELERWLNPDRELAPLVGGPARWSPHHVDRPAVLHARRTISGRTFEGGVDVLLNSRPPVDCGSVITALRLVLDAPISIIFKEHACEGLLAWGGLGTTWGSAAHSLSPVRALDDATAPQVLRVWELLQTSPNSQLLRLPVRRWESSLVRGNLEDALIDAWISLEALLMPNITAELGHRAGLRLAELLGMDGKSRRAIFADAKKSYDWRSRIVHGSLAPKPPDLKELDGVAQVTREYARQALLRVLERTEKFAAGELESGLLGRESPR